nr:alpha/beta hydrolase [uncultured Massilia sp.]
MRQLLALAVLTASVSLPAHAAPAAPGKTMRAVVADPAPDARYPASNRQVLILNQGNAMNGLFMLAAGSGPKPTMLLLHGLPGNEQNLDLAQAARRAGWNVLTLHYRGSWGSAGRFSLAGAGDDVDAAMAFLKQDENVRRYQVDTRRIVVAGHSMGGFFAARYAATHDDVDGAILLDPWNIGARGKEVRAHPETRQDRIADMGADFGTSLAGTDAATLMREVEAHADDWDLTGFADGLARKPLLVVGAQRGLGATVAPVVAAVKARPGAQVQSITLPSDHAFADHRIALATATITWLDARAKPARGR